MSPVQTAFALLVPLFWGLQFVVIKVGLTAFPPLFFVALRFAAVAAILLPFVGRPSRRELGPTIAISVFFGGLNFGLVFVGLSQGLAGVSAVANQLSIPFTLLLAWPVLGEQPSSRVIVGVALAFGGVALTVADPNAAVKTAPTLLVAAAGFAWAVGSVLTKLHGPFEPLKLMAWMSLFTVPQVMAASVVLEHGQLASLHAAGFVAWSAFAYTVLFGAVAGWGLWFWLVARCSMSRLAPFALLQTVFAVAAGALVLHEPLTPTLVAGAVICVAGVAVSQSRPSVRVDRSAARSTPVGTDGRTMPVSPDMSCESLRIDDMRFAFHRAGHGGMPILLLHGWPQTSFAWRRVTPLLEQGFDVVVPDLPGFGRSSKPESGFDKKTVARRLRQFVKALGLPRIALVGHDLGGHVAYAYAAQWPDEVSHLVFIESSLPGFGQEEAMDVAKGGSWHFGFNMAGDIAEALVQGREHLFVDHVMHRETVGLFDPESVGVDDVAHYAQALARPGGLRSSFGYYRTLPVDRGDNLAWGRTPLRMPVLAVGATGGYGPESARTIRRVASDVRDLLIERCGHYPAEERPAELAAAIRDFLTPSSSAPASRVAAKRSPTQEKENR